jgi:hypothetical protein
MFSWIQRLCKKLVDRVSEALFCAFVLFLWQMNTHTQHIYIYNIHIYICILNIYIYTYINIIIFIIVILWEVFLRSGSVSLLVLSFIFKAF